MPDLHALYLVIGIWFVLYSIVWVLEVGFLLDRWMWWRRTRDVTEWVPATGAQPNTPEARRPVTVFRV